MDANNNPQKNSVPWETFLIVFFTVFLIAVLFLVSKDDRVSFVQVLALAVLIVISPFANIIRNGKVTKGGEQKKPISGMIDFLKKLLK